MFRDSIAYLRNRPRAGQLRNRLSLFGTERGLPLLHNVQAGSGTDRTFCSVGKVDLLQKVKRPEPQTEHLPRSTAKVKNEIILRAGNLRDAIWIVATFVKVAIKSGKE